MIPLLLLLMSAAPGETNVAPGWSADPSAAYQASIDHQVKHGGRGSLTLKSKSADPAGFAVRQRMRAESWRGRKLRFSGWIKTDRIESGGGALWLRIDMANGDYVLDGMLESSGRAWTKVEIVAKVPDDAVGISFGARMVGEGQMWADDLQFEEAAPRALTTTIERRKSKGTANLEVFRNAPAKPVNLNFEQ